MILETPTQIPEIENNGDKSIRDKYFGYESTFIILHPFLKNDSVNRENEKELTRLNWSEFVDLAKLKDIKELDRILAFQHCARSITSKSGWIKYKKTIELHNLLDAEVDKYPVCLVYPTLNYLYAIGYRNIFLYSEYNESNILYEIEALINKVVNWPKQQTRILTPDYKILLETNADERFTYVSADKLVIDKMVAAINLEGFYCTENTKSYWSDEIESGDTIDWSSAEG